MGSILIAGVGNIFHGDDAFGVEVARRLATVALPDGVRVADFGIRGFDLAYAFTGDHDAVILLDATPRGGAPGTLYTLEIEPNGGTAAFIETHGMDVASILRLAAALGRKPRRVLLVGCEPAAIDAEAEEVTGLSAPVAAALEDAVEMTLALVARVRSEVFPDA